MFSWVLDVAGDGLFCTGTQKSYDKGVTERIEYLPLRVLVDFLSNPSLSLLGLIRK